jgi:hypothetical protein
VPQDPSDPVPVTPDPPDRRSLESLRRAIQALLRSIASNRALATRLRDRHREVEGRVADGERELDKLRSLESDVQTQSRAAGRKEDDEISRELGDHDRDR